MSSAGVPFCDSASAFLSVVRGVDVSGFDEPGLQSLLVEVRSVQRCLDGLVTRIGVRANELAAVGRSAPADETARGSGDVGSRQARREAARAKTAAEEPAVGDALSSGSLSGEHADSIARHLAKLSDEQRAAFDVAGLIAQADGMPPETFDRLVKRAVEAVLGDHGLSDTKAKQAASEFRHWVDRKTGMGRFAGALDPERYEILINAIEQHMNTLASDSDEPLAKTANLAAEALVGLVSNSGAGRGGLPSITVVVDHDTMVHGPHAGSIRQTETGHDLAAESVARLCCDAVIRKVVLDERGVPINVGRKYRTATDAQWAAIKAMHSTCAWAGCDAPISWCQAHHIHEWEHGGPTDLDNLIPLCNQHHHRVHEGQWHIKLTPDRALKIYKPDGTRLASVPTTTRWLHPVLPLAARHLRPYASRVRS